MDITRNENRATRRAPTEWFTGTVSQDPIVEAPAPARVRAVLVSFEPAARTAWHTHPLGQTLYIVSGCGLVQSWAGEARFVHPGDSVWIPPGEKHWHGACADEGMSHIAIQEALDETAAEWLEKVTDAQYETASASAG